MADIHHRPGQRYRMPRNRQRGRPDQGPDPLFARRRLGPDLAVPGVGLAAAVDRAREGRHPPGARGGGERDLGSLGQVPG